MHSKPVFLFVFANDHSHSLQIDEEWRQAEQALQQAEDAGKLTFNLTPSTTLEDIWHKFNRFHNQIAVFHYGGHSNEQGLNLSDTTLRGKNLATLIGQEQQLKLAFLNGCSNVAQVKLLFAAGTPAVIATTAPISDQRAAKLSTQFYNALTSGRTIDEAFAIAAAFVNNAEKETLVAYRGQGLENQTSELPWGLYVHDTAVLEWKIPDVGSTKTKPVNVESFTGTLNITGDHRKAIPNFHTPFPSSAEKLIGREAEMQQLREKLLISNIPVLLTGMGGLGKTRMAIEYVNRFREEYDYIVWIEQLGDLITDLTGNFALHQALNFQTTRDPQVDVQNLLFQLSRLDSSLLLVIDNTDEQIEALAAHLPKAPKAHVLLTSRLDLSDLFSVMHLGFLSPEFAQTLFFEHYKRERDEEVVSLILDHLDYHTLTVELFAKTANRRKIDLKELRSLIEARGLALGKRADDVRLMRDPKRQLKKIFHFLQVVFDIGDLGEEEKALLQQLAALPPIFIPLTGLAYLLNIDREDEAAWDDFVFTLTQLQEKGWVMYDGTFREGDGFILGKQEQLSGEVEEASLQKEAYKMHRVIQDVVWEQLKPSFVSIQNLFEQVRGLLYFDDTKDNPVEKFPLVAFAERLLILFPEEQNEDTALLRNTLSRVYRQKGRYKDAQFNYEEALRWYEAAGEEKEEGLATLQSNLALIHQSFGRYEVAAALLEKALQLDQKNFEDGHPILALRQSNLATVYRGLTRYDEAATLLEKALKSDEINFGVHHSNVAKNQSNLALVYSDLGRDDEAAVLLEKALRSDEVNFGADHPSVATRQSNLAVVYRNLGRHIEALVLLGKALHSDRSNFGENHPNTAIKQSNLALVYHDLGQYKEAFHYFKTAINTMIAVFGENHPHVHTIQENINSTIQKGAKAGNEYCLKLIQEMKLEEE